MPDRPFATYVMVKVPVPLEVLDDPDLSEETMVEFLGQHVLEQARALADQ